MKGWWAMNTFASYIKVFFFCLENINFDFKFWNDFINLLLYAGLLSSGKAYALINFKTF